MSEYWILKIQQVWFEKSDLFCELLKAHTINHLPCVNAMLAGRSVTPVFLLLSSTSLHVNQKTADILPIRLRLPVTLSQILLLLDEWCASTSQYVRDSEKKFRKSVAYNWNSKFMYSLSIFTVQRFCWVNIKWQHF